MRRGAPECLSLYSHLETGRKLFWAGGVLLAVIVLGAGLYILRRRAAAAAKPGTYECTVCDDRDCECRRSDS